MVTLVLINKPMLLSGCSSCPAVGSVPSLVSISFPFVLGFFATGGGTFVPLCACSVSLSAFVGEETSWFFCVAAFASAPVLVSTTTFLLLLAKIKLAVLEGDLRRADGDVGECKLRRELGPPTDLAAVRRRIASCRFIDGDTEAAWGDLIGRDGTEEDDTGGTTRGSDLGVGGCDAVMEVGEGRLIIRDFLMGFWGASVLEDGAWIFLIMTSVSGCSCTCGASALLLTDGSSTVWSEGDIEGELLERSCTGGGIGTFAGADKVFSLGGGFSGIGWQEFSDGAEMENRATEPSVVASSSWWGSTVGGGGGILWGGVRKLLNDSWFASHPGGASPCGRPMSVPDK